MSILPMDNRPSYVEFKVVAEEDREASIEAGHYVAKDVVIAVITPPGGNLVVEKPAEEWLRSKRQDPNFRHYDGAYRAFLEGREAPVDGTPVREWPVLSPAQVEMCIKANVKTVEDLATAPEAALARIGMGARALQQKAQAWLSSASDHGKTAERLNKLERQIETLKDEIEQKDREIAALKADAGESGGRKGRKAA